MGNPATIAALQDVVYHQAPMAATQYAPFNPAGATASSNTNTNGHSGSSGQVYYDAQKGQYYTKNAGVLGGGNGTKNYIGSSPTGSAGGTASSDATIYLPANVKMNGTPSVNELFPLMGLLAQMPQTAGNNPFNVNDSSGAGRFMGNGSLLASSNYPAPVTPNGALSMPTSNGNLAGYGIASK